jgi:hypothetical protein
VRDEALYLLAEKIYEDLLKIPSRLMKHKCGQPISKETAVARIYMTLEEAKQSEIIAEIKNEDNIPQAIKDLRGYEKQLANNETELDTEVMEKLYKAAEPYL